ncbi:MAG TPA: hypothetical protein VIR16_03090 [Candidatus Limnocylindrales bacterium]
MRRRLVVAVSALIAAAALIGLPAPAGSTAPSPARTLQAAAFVQVPVSSDAPASLPAAAPDAGLRAEGYLGDSGRLVERGSAPAGPTARPTVTQPSVAAGTAWKPPRYRLSGQASFYDNGTTAMRLPQGTIVRICGAAGCILRTVTDWGPQDPARVVDLYRPDFFAICGCAPWSGLTQVTVSVY